MYLQRDTLTRALAFSSTEETRYYLNGVHLVCDGSTARVESTDGHAVYFWTGPVEKGTVCDVIIPREPLAAALKLKSYRRYPVLEVHIDANSISLCGTTFTAIDASFPDTSRIIPIETTGELAGYSAHLIGRVAKAFNLEGALLIHCNGNGPGIYKPSSQETVLIMPMRGAAPITTPLDLRETRDALFPAPRSDAAPALENA